MWIRLRFDVTPRDLAWGVWGCSLPGRRELLQEQAEQHWTASDQPVSDPAVVVLSVRSGFDLLLSALQLPRQSEVLMSALTVPDMVRIAEHHGLIPVPVDLVEHGCTPSLESLRRSITPNTRVLVVAHLFGTRIDMAPILEFARAHDLFVIEDCAQAYHGDDYRGDVGADASLFSFGPIKTATALGGGVMRLKSPALANRLRQIQYSYPVQNRMSYLCRLLKYTAFKTLAARPFFTLIANVCRAVHVDADTLVSGAARNFPADNLFEHLRRQPSVPLLRMLLHRWRRYDAGRLQQRTERGQWFAEQLGETFLLDQRQATFNNYWVFPILVDNQADTVEWMRRHGFDATGRTRLTVVPPPADRPELDAVNVRQTLRRIVFLPWYADIAPRLLQQMVKLLRDRSSSSPMEPSSLSLPPVQIAPLPTGGQVASISSHSRV